VLPREPWSFTVSRTFSETLDTIAGLTNLKLVTRRPTHADDKTSAYSAYSANMLAKSKFGRFSLAIASSSHNVSHLGDLVLANISLDNTSSCIRGHTRIRSKSNILAFLIGSKISSFMGCES
jgi:hypothetical protein